MAGGFGRASRRYLHLRGCGTTAPSVCPVGQAVRCTKHNVQLTRTLHKWLTAALGPGTRPFHPSLLLASMLQQRHSTCACTRLSANHARPPCPHFCNAY
eukprot:362732-Chlamydomonas_euryale.AAC.2